MTVFQKPYGFIDTPQTGKFKGQSGKLKVLPLLVWTLKTCHSFYVAWNWRVEGAK